MEIDLQMLAMIFFINMAYVTLNTIRFLLTMKGYRLIAPLVSMVGHEKIPLHRLRIHLRPCARRPR